MEKMIMGILVTKIEAQPQHNGYHINLPEPRFYSSLAKLAGDMNIDLYVFSPNEFSSRGLYGYRWKNMWVKEQVQYPDIIYDRCFYSNSEQKKSGDELLSKLLSYKKYQLLNNTLPSKLYVHDALRSNEQLIPYLPHTEELITISSINKWISLYEQGVVVKPASGMHGKGVLHITSDRNHSCFHVQGRSLSNEPIDLDFYSELNLYKWLFHFKKKRSFLIQPYLSLRTEDDCPFDIRVLMQKDEAGYWQCTGSVARIGDPYSLTSNMHGGGKPARSLATLKKIMGGYKAAHLLQKVHMISGQTVNTIEQSFGRFGELALDFGVTANGNIWLLECNSKPGREAFMQTNHAQSKLVFQRPLQYGSYLIKRMNNIHSVV